jgi:cysteinyl-tRNA synthetase
MTEDYFECLKIMGVDTVDSFPYATEHIQEMLDTISMLIQKGYAYPLDGDVYFDVTKDDDYGKLSGRKIGEMLAGTRVEANERKRNPADFALWKKSRPGEPAWDSPWGSGRPGWHIECSAMSMKILGPSLDIHGGGLDLLFPHHENELAQSESCSGKPFQSAQEANKLAGSKGAASVKELFAVHQPETVRFFLLATHYRSPIELSDENIAATGTGLEGFYRLFETFERITGQSFYALEVSATRKNSAALKGQPAEFFTELNQLRDRFLEAMDDDFNTGGAVGVLFELRKCINGYIAKQKLGGGEPATKTDAAALTQAMTLLKELANLLGVFRAPIAKAGGGADDEFVGSLMQLLIAIRAEARKKKNFDIADQIRNGLTELKVTLEDRPDGTMWRRD